MITLVLALIWGLEIDEVRDRYLQDPYLQTFDHQWVNKACVPKVLHKILVGWQWMPKRWYS